MQAESNSAAPDQICQTWWLYLLDCKHRRTYAGIALDVRARFELHASGKGAKFTRANPPLTILGAKSFATKNEALRAEIQLKALTREQKFAWAKENAAPVLPAG
ncbi:MAG TPA: GIY-YIG nuclease family protein [Steroidobacteraceae bacterium]|nr:GIY-YIG nuclease family protein [Steroidobacteraceae bacterium]